MREKDIQNFEKCNSFIHWIMKERIFQYFKFKKKIDPIMIYLRAWKLTSWVWKYGIFIRDSTYYLNEIFKSLNLNLKCFRNSHNQIVKL